MSQFSSSCDYCSDKLFTIDISGNKLQLLNSQKYYTCLKCEKLDYVMNVILNYLMIMMEIYF